MIGRRFFLLTIGLFALFLSAGTVLGQEGEPLVTIDGQAHTVDAFREWWRHWQEKEMPFPDTPDPYIDWLLMVREAKSMELYDRPSYKDKVNTFLKARSLMLLKRDEIDEKIQVTAQEMDAEYKRNYAPRWQVVILYFKSSEAAAKISEDLRNSALNIQDAIALTGSPGGPLTHLQRWVRPKDTPLPWQKVFNSMETGQISAPVPGDQGHGSVVFKLLVRLHGDEQDYASVRVGIERLLHKQAQAQLTRDLIEQLKIKYHVQIDQELMAKIDPEKIDDDLLDRTVISTSTVKVTARYFLEQLRKFQGAKRSPQERMATLEQEKQRVAEQMLGNSLTVLEALNRHYEKTPALRSSYEFYLDHRLVKELEQSPLAENATVSNEEIATYYASHKEEFLEPAAVRYLLVQGESTAIEKIWVAMLGGAEIKDMVAKFNLAAPVDSFSTIEQLASELQSAVKDLGVDEVSKPFVYNGKSSLVKMLARKPAAMAPLGKVAPDIASRLKKEKDDQGRGAYLALLKKKASIAVNENAWLKLRNEQRGKGKEL